MTVAEVFRVIARGFAGSDMLTVGKWRKRYTGMKLLLSVSLFLFKVLKFKTRYVVCVKCLFLHKLFSGGVSWLEVKNEWAVFFARLFL